MEKDICIINLSGKNNYAIVTPNRITYGLNASKKEFDSLLSEEKTLLLKRKNRKKTTKKLDSVISMGIIPTFDCNLKCLYCYSLGGDTKENLLFDNISEFLKNEGSGEKLLKLNFVGGGEPFLNFELVSDLVSYAKKIFKKVEIGVVTNGTFNGKVLDWIIENKVSIRISYDSIFHDLQRPYRNGESSRNKILQNIKIFREIKYPVSIQTIITKHGVNHMNSIIDELVALNIEVVKFEPSLSTNVSRYDGEIDPDPVKYARALLGSIKYIADRNLNLVIDTGFFAEPSNDYYCGMPTGNMVVTPHGLITSCVEVARSTDPYSEVLIYGILKNKKASLWKDRLSFLNNMHFRNQIGGCKICNLRLICHGGCPMANIWENGIPIKKSSFTCKIEHELIPGLLLMIAERKDIAKIVIEEPCIN